MKNYIITNKETRPYVEKIMQASGIALEKVKINENMTVSGSLSAAGGLLLQGGNRVALFLPRHGEENPHDDETFEFAKRQLTVSGETKYFRIYPVNEDTKKIPDLNNFFLGKK